MLVVTPGWGHSERINKHFWLWVPAFRGDDDRRHCEELLVRRSSTSEGGSDEAIHSLLCAARWIASRSLSSGARSRDPLARNDGKDMGHHPVIRAGRNVIRASWSRCR